MRVLFVSVPVRAHAFPLVPLAWAARAAGHDVLWASAGDGGSVADAGFPMVDLAPRMSIRPMFVSLFARHDGLTEPRLATAAENATIAEIFAKINLRLGDSLLDVVDSWRPDVIVHDATAVIGAAVAAGRGIPAVRHDYALENAHGLRDRFGAAMADELGRFGIDRLPDERYAINITPRSVVPSHDWPMRLVPFNGGGHLPGWLFAPRRRPRVAVTLGLTWGNLFGPMAEIVDAAADVDADFVLAVGDRDLSPLGPLPPNVTSAGWVPLSDLLPHTDAVIHHGGGGTGFAAMASGVPQLIFPGGISHFEGSEAMRVRGLALVADEQDVDPKLIRAVLEDSAVAEAAAQVRQEIADMPAPPELVARLAGVVDASRT